MLVNIIKNFLIIYVNNSMIGKRIIEDITYEDSIDNCFYVIPDGSYIIQTTENIYLYGEGFTI